MKTLCSSILACALAISLNQNMIAADQTIDQKQNESTPSDRVDGRYWTELRPERLITPCTPFAKDYPRPPKILFFVPGLMGPREVSELNQRFNMQFDAVLYHGPWTTDALGQTNLFTGESLE